MVIKVRARKSEDKEERRQAILDAGLQVWKGTSFTEFTMAAVAERAGIVKGTVYLYFETKEQLFLALISDMLAAYFDAVDAGLGDGGRWTKSRVVDVLAAALEGLDPLLLTMLGNICEHNVSYEPVLAFKRLMLERFSRTAALLAKRLPFLDLETAMRFITHFSAFITGLAHMTYPSPVVEQVFEIPELAVLRLDLITELRAGAMSLLAGMERSTK